jgi:hypothetical protein
MGKIGRELMALPGGNPAVVNPSAIILIGLSAAVKCTGCPILRLYPILGAKNPLPKYSAYHCQSTIFYYD